MRDAVSEKALGDADIPYVETSRGLLDAVTLGQDLIELLTSGMYVDPLSVLREYVQNSVDAIDEAKLSGLIQNNEKGRIDITLDAAGRAIRIRDNGPGIQASDFLEKMLALGASTKRATSARGFRGVGRLGGLGYCQELIFRSRSENDEKVLEIEWSARRLRELLRSTGSGLHLDELIAEITTTREIEGQDFPSNFFEVEMIKPLRLANDCLLNLDIVSAYLSEVAPVPFHPDFGFGGAISSRISKATNHSEVEIFLNDAAETIYRPHRNRFHVSDTKQDDFKEIEWFDIAGHDGGTAAIGWVLHHGYLGAIPAKSGISGFRARVGNLQTGDNRLFRKIFPEERFNSWSVGEVHVLDERVTPNGRRDAFEENVHLSNMLTHITPVAKDIAARCRKSSQIRNRLKTFELTELKTYEEIEALKKSLLPQAGLQRLRRDVGEYLADLEKLATSNILPELERTRLGEKMKTLRAAVKKIDGISPDQDPLARLPENEREIFRRFLALLYESSPNRAVAQSIIDRMVARL